MGEEPLQLNLVEQDEKKIGKTKINNLCKIYIYFTKKVHTELLNFGDLSIYFNYRVITKTG